MSKYVFRYNHGTTGQSTVTVLANNNSEAFKKAWNIVGHQGNLVLSYVIEKDYTPSYDAPSNSNKEKDSRRGYE